MQGRGTDRRAGGLQAEYRRKMARYDQRFHGTGLGENGPLVQRLEGYGKLWGLVVGPWGEGSKDLHSLVSVIGDSMVAAKARARGWEGGEGELGQTIGLIRRRLSCTSIRAQALCLLSRIWAAWPRSKSCC